MNLERKYMLLSAALASLKSDLLVSREAMARALSAFNLELTKNLRSLPNHTQPETRKATPPLTNKKNSDHEVDSPVAKPDTSDYIGDPNQKKLFKKIIFESHPDRLRGKSKFEKDTKKKLFDRATNAMESDDYHSIVAVASELRIPIPKPTRENIKNLQKTKEKISNELKQIKTSYAWVWYFEEDEKKRTEIIESFIKLVKEGKATN